MDSKEDRTLLRRFEPILRFTQGESFFPIDAEIYVESCSLWMQPLGKEPICLVPEGELTLEKLGKYRSDDSGGIIFLKFIEPLNIKEMAIYQLKLGLSRKELRKTFRVKTSRLSRVGFGSRIVDALFTTTLLARGRVPGDTAIAAILAYQEILTKDERYCYYGRVVRQNNWVILQYWFFYPFNNWRSGFHGANDHEADWEQVCIYLSEDNQGEFHPEWVAYASHEFAGDDLRRRWDDPELQKVGEHPVVYVGAGSHASYYQPGEYLAEIELPFLSPLIRIYEGIQNFWRRLLRRQRLSLNQDTFKRPFNVFRIPFVDYARGDGICIGPGCEKTWDEPILLSPLPVWASQYRGLFGLYVQDPIAGESAPAGPVYNRNGAVRRSWVDPLGWAGLDKIPPSNFALKHTLERCEEIEKRQKAIATQIEQTSQEMIKLGIESTALYGKTHLAKELLDIQSKISALSNDLKNLRAQYATDTDRLEALHQYANQLRQGLSTPPRTHIHRYHQALTDEEKNLNRIAEIWFAISIGVVLLSFVGIALFARQYLLRGLIAVITMILFLEAGFRRQLSRLITSVTIGLAVVCSLILIFKFFWTIVVASVVIAGGYLIWNNIQELRG